MAYRTLLTYGTVTEPTAAIVKVDKTIVHNGPLESGLLFKFITNVSLNGKVNVSINVFYGSFTITHNRVIYPALVNGQKGFVNMPQHIDQPNLPLSVKDIQIYDHYMFNGPVQWIIKGEVENRYVTIDTMEDYQAACGIGFIDPDYQYDAIILADESNDISSLQK